MGAVVIDCTTLYLENSMREDKELVYRVQQYITGANAHTINAMLSRYIMSIEALKETTSPEIREALIKDAKRAEQELKNFLGQKFREKRKQQLHKLYSALLSSTVSK